MQLLAAAAAAVAAAVAGAVAAWRQLGRLGESPCSRLAKQQEALQLPNQSAWQCRLPSFGRHLGDLQGRQMVLMV